jgi:hypothetical protein
MKNRLFCHGAPKPNERAFAGGLQFHPPPADEESWQTLPIRRILPA